MPLIKLSLIKVEQSNIELWEVGDLSFSTVFLRWCGHVNFIQTKNSQRFSIPVYDRCLLCTCAYRYIFFIIHHLDTIYDQKPNKGLTNTVTQHRYTARIQKKCIYEQNCKLCREETRKTRFNQVIRIDCTVLLAFETLSNAM